MQSKTIFRPFSTFEYLKTIDKKKKNFFLSGRPPKGMTSVLNIYCLITYENSVVYMFTVYFFTIE